MAVAISDQVLEAIVQAKAALRHVIVTQKRRINRYDNQSPVIDGEVLGAMTDCLGELITSLVRVSDLPCTSQTKRIRSAIDIRLLQDKLETCASIRSYAGPHDEVLMTLTGNIVRQALERINDLADKGHIPKGGVGADGHVPENMVYTLTGMSRRNIEVRHCPATTGLAK